MEQGLTQACHDGRVSREKDVRLRTNRRLSPGVDLPVSSLRAEHMSSSHLVKCQPLELDSDWHKVNGSQIRLNLPSPLWGLYSR